METRLFLKVNDLVTVTGASERTAKRHLAQLRDAMNKKRLTKGFQEITIPEYCEYIGIALDEFCQMVRVKIPGKGQIGTI